MKNNSSEFWRILAFLGLGGFFAFAYLQVNHARATSDNRQHELGVYSLCFYENDWKDRLYS